MKELHKTSFWESLIIQKRVINALLLRELITRYGRNNIGFLWLFVEPLLATTVIVLMWKFFRVNQFSTLNIIAFAITGYPLMMMWRNASNRAMGSISANVSLLYHRNVRPLDTIWARMFLEIIGATIAQVLIMAILILIKWIPWPSDIFYMLLAWLLMALFAIGLGLVICAIALKVEVFSKFWSAIGFVMFPLSGAFFFVHSLPHQAHSYLMWAPMIHGTEMFRHGYFGSTQITYEDSWYLLICDLVLLLLGLAMISKFSKEVEPQ